MRPRQPLVHTGTASTLAAVVGDNVYRLRTERGWSQAQLAAQLNARGILGWQPSTVALVETGKQRADKVLELAALCQVFAVPLEELLAGPLGVPIKVDGGPALPLESIRLALSGTTASPRIAEVELPASVWDSAPLARALGISSEQFRALVFDVFGTWNYFNLRDAKAGMMPGFPYQRAADAELDPSVRAHRGHATREILAALAAVLERDGIEAIWERTREAWEQERQASLAYEREQVAQQWARDTGTWPTEDELNDYFNEETP